MDVRIGLSVMLALALGACGDDGMDGADAAALPDGAPADAGPDVDGAGPVSDGALPHDSGPTGETTAVLPGEGAEVLYSAAVRARAPAGAAEVEVTEPVSGASCIALAPYYECLLDLSGAEPGPLSVELVARDGDGAELSSGTLGLVRRAIEVPCTGDGGELNACIVARAEEGDSAGFDGVTYINADDAHARVRTDSMTGIDARVLAEPPAMVPDDSDLGLMNESRAYTSEGSCSLMRCFPTSRQRIAAVFHEGSFLYMVPEHRDVGIRDFYQWQAPFFLLSQGSSSSERDEIAKGLRALAVMTPGARDAAHASGAIGPLLSFLIVRARQESDVAYLTPEAHPTALPDSESAERILELAAAIVADEVPPVITIDSHEPTFPDEWNMVQSLTSPYAVGHTPITTPETVPDGEFAIEVTLAPTTDASGRELLFLPAVLREAGSDVTVERLDESGTRWSISGDFPEDETILTGGQERIVSRVTVAFFPHNGVWLGAPVMVSVGARQSDERSSNGNNLD